MNRLFRKYHRWLGIILALPLVTTILSGMGYTIANEWFHRKALGNLMVRIHTFQIFHLEKLLPVWIGVGIIGLLITGLEMMGVFGKFSKPARTLKS
jgi:hypothetical protein